MTDFGRAGFQRIDLGQLRTEAHRKPAPIPAAACCAAILFA